MYLSWFITSYSCLSSWCKCGCHNPSLGLATKARGCKVAGQEEDMRVKSHAPGNPSELPCWELKSQKDSQIFRVRLQGSKLIILKNYLYHWKAIEVSMSEMGSHHPFGHLKHKLWPKERPGVKVAVWLPTTKSRESTRFPCVQAKCNIPLESFRQGLQLCFRPHCNQTSA
jgi:hypothetical protein